MPKRALKSHLLPWSPGAAVPTCSFHPREAPTVWLKHDQYCCLGAAWDFWVKVHSVGQSTKTGALGCFFWHIPPEATTKDSTFSRALVAQPTLAEQREVCGLVDVPHECQSGVSESFRVTWPAGL